MIYKNKALQFSFVGFVSYNGYICADTTGQAAVVLGGNEYTDSNFKIDITKVSPDEILDFIKSKSTTLMCSGKALSIGDCKDYFIKTVTGEKFDFKGENVTLVKDGQCKIEIVKKSDVVKFVYKGKKKLTAKNEDAILKALVQGKAADLASLKVFVDDKKIKMFGTDFIPNTDSGKLLGSKVLPLDFSKDIEIVLEDDNIVGKQFKPIVVELGEGIDLIDEDKYVKNLEAATFSNKPLTLKNALLDVKPDGTNKFFVGNPANLKISKNGGDTALVCTEDTEVGDLTFVYVTFTKADVNPYFLQKKIQVKFDEKDDLSVSDEAKTKINTALGISTEASKDAFVNKNSFSAQELYTELQKVENASSKKILNKVTEGIMVKFGTGTPVKFDDNTKKSDVDVEVTIPIACVNPEFIKLNLTFDDTNVKNSDGCKLKEATLNAIKTVLAGINYNTAKADFVKTLKGGAGCNIDGGIADTDIQIGGKPLGDTIIIGGKVIIPASKFKAEAFEPKKDSTPGKGKGATEQDDNNGGKVTQENKGEGSCTCSGGGTKENTEN